MMLRTFAFGLLLLAGSTVIRAQAQTDTSQVIPKPVVTVSISANGVRYAAFGSIKKMRLEVFGAGGDPVFNSDFQAGSVHDWRLVDGSGQRLPDGTYLCVITVRDLSGRLSVQQGAVLVRGGEASLQLSETEQASYARPDNSIAPATDDTADAVTLTAHDGSDGQVVSTRGALSFRAGDFFAGRDRELMRLTPDGNLGLGVATPQARLDVAGTIRARGGIQFDDGTVLTSARGARLNMSLFSANTPPADGSTAAAIGGAGTANRLAKWLDGAGNLGDSVITDSGGNIGIGTASPANVFEVRRDQAFNGTLSSMTQLMVRNDSPTGFSAISIWGDGSERGRYQYNSAHPNIFLTSIGQVPFYFGTNDTVRMNVDGNTGNVGIGTGFTPATQKLEVAGNIRVTGSAIVDGNIAAKYQDVAEWVQASAPLAAGTVVTLDRGRSNAVRASARPYDTHVAGVVSAQPGVILGEDGEGKVMVATTGRVRVKVDATGRPIRVGDLLVTSSKAGIAMRSLPFRAGRARIHRPGTIIGKALEPLTSGKGEILVLLSLQ